MLFGPDDLWESTEYIINNISFWSVEVEKNTFVFVVDIDSLYNVWVKI